MHRWLTAGFFVGAALAQSGGPIQAEVDAVRSARQAGRFAEASAHREGARDLLERLPADASPFPGWVRSVADLYSAAGRTLEARAIVMRAVERTAAGEAARANHDELLFEASERWEADRNLIQAVACLEQASPATERDLRLADLYKQMGRHDAYDGVVARLRALPGDEQVAGFFEKHGMLDEAAAIYRDMAAQSADPESAAEAYRMLERVERRRGRDNEAAGANRWASEAGAGGDAPVFGGGLADVSFAISNAAGKQTRAEAAVREGRFDDGFVYGLEALGEAERAPVDESVLAGIPVLASMLAARQARGMADQLWERLFAVVEGWQVDTLIPLLRVAREHARFLMQGCDRIPAARDALARYRDLLAAANGSGSGEVAKALRMMVELEQGCGTPDRARWASQELTRLEEALAGR